ncbi:MAG: His/Gly/Thr/Pro-type tRNA ligase C-terminal domain-containing protein, partial [Gammaproteobacteria bacterium]|nr:His/Gly/Thr/Pro-type tRNA ligase C-terminal domain-containing protein [Gammaproteobacteria bacterium]
ELPGNDPHVYLVLGGEQGIRCGMVFAEELREAVPGLRIQTNCGGGSFKSQFKRADRSGAGIALVIGDDEAALGQVAFKPLRGAGEQEVLARQDVAGRLGRVLDLQLNKLVDE